MSHEKRRILGLLLVLMLFTLPILQNFDLLPRTEKVFFEQNNYDIKNVKVIPGGQSIGVKLNSAGIMVIGYHYIELNGNKISPSEQGNIKIGDLIIAINGKKINNISEITDLTNKYGKMGKQINLSLIRGKEKLDKVIDPIYDEKNKLYRLGLYVRDHAAGVGTITFYLPDYKKYGALGHVIIDMDTQNPINVKDGKIFNSTVTSIIKGEKGIPGEKHTIFQENKVIGDITKNTPFGIFGNIKEVPEGGFINEPIPIGTNEEIKLGPAEILTVIEGKKVEKFSIEITNIIRQSYPATKGLIIKVTDPRLLNKTGGIIQGMSGSPIIQNGKLIGAVTHVFVNDPTAGYGTFIEWMLREIDVKFENTDEKSLKVS